MSSLDDDFKAQAEAAEAAERERQSNRGKGNFSRDYEKIEWAGLEPGITKVVRALGEKPYFGSNSGNKPGSQYDARVVRIASLLSDKNERFRVVYPLGEAEEDFILTRIARAVNDFEYVKQERIEQGGKVIQEEKNVRKFKYQGTDAFNIVNFNNLPETDSQRKFGLLGKGFAGKEVLIMNVIDRSDMAWHREHNHTKLLSQKITRKLNKEGKEVAYIDEGISAYGFALPLQTRIIKFYGFWENYDIGIERTGIKNSPYNIFNASKTPEMVNSGVTPVIGPLTEEEKNWERYDLDKLFGPVSYTKLYNRLRIKILMIDDLLGTHFERELKSLSDAERATWSTEKAQQETSEEPDEQPSEDEEESFERPAKAQDTSSVSQVVLADLPGFEKLSNAEKEQIISYEKPNRASATPDAYTIVFKDQPARMPKCPTCKTKAPETFKVCPGCGEVF